jgi:hypothetical protein
MRVLSAAGTLALVAVATSSMLEAATVSRGPALRDGRRERTRTEWAARLAGREGRKVTGAATAKPTADGTGTLVTVTLDGDTPGATRPWHVHTGSCRQSGGVVGGGRAYTPLVVDAKGQASGTATIPVPLADSASYYVNIHDSAAAMGVIVACGDLTKR